MTNLQFILKNASDADFTQLLFYGIDHFLMGGGTELYTKIVNTFWTWFENRPDSLKHTYARRYFNIWLSLPYKEEEWILK